MYQVLNKDNIFPKLLISLSKCDAKMDNLNLENLLGEFFPLDLRVVLVVMHKCSSTCGVHSLGCTVPVHLVQPISLIFVGIHGLSFPSCSFPQLI